MKKNILKLTKKPFVKNILILSSGTAGAQIIAMLLSPIITRLYGPEAYGIMGSFMAIILLLYPVAALTLPVAIVLPKDSNEAKGIIQLSFIIALILSIVTGIVLITLKESIVDLFNLESISPYLFWLPFVILSAGILQIFEQWLIRTKKFRISAKTTFSQSIIINGSKAGFGVFYPSSKILIFFSAIQYGLKFVQLFYLSKIKVKVVVNEIFIKKYQLKKLFIKYKDFPIFRAPESFISSISSNLPVLLLASFNGPIAVGFYSISRTVLNVPTQLVARSVGDVFYPRISEAANNNEKLTPIIKKATLSLGLIGIVPFGLIVILGPDLYRIIFGEDWVAAGEYARWIAFWSYFMFVNKPCVSTLPVLSAQKFHLFHTVITLITRVMMLSIGFLWFDSDIIAIALFGISGGLLSLALIIVTLILSRRFDNRN